MDTFADWKQAHTFAQTEANKYNRPMGLEKAKEYGKTVYRVKWIAADPRQRFGWELRCEVVNPDRVLVQS